MVTEIYKPKFKINEVGKHMGFYSISTHASMVIIGTIDGICVENINHGIIYKLGPKYIATKW